VTPRVLSGLVWHQGHPWYGLISFQDPARGDGRYHRIGDEGVWYCSTTALAAWAQLFRVKLDDGLSPLHVKRRIGRCRVRALVVLDLSDDATRRVLGVAESELRADENGRCQAIAHRARSAGFEGILAPSAALNGALDVVAFKAGIPKVLEEHSRVQRAPRNMKACLRRTRRRTS